MAVSPSWSWLPSESGRVITTSSGFSAGWPPPPPPPGGIMPSRSSRPSRPSRSSMPSISAGSSSAGASSSPLSSEPSDGARAASACVSGVLAKSPGGGSWKPWPPDSPTPRTGWKDSCAVWPTISAASAGSCTPGSSTMIRFSPERDMFASATPRRSMRWRSTSRTLSVLSESATVPSVPSWVSRTIWVPPLRSSPRRGGMNHAAPNATRTTSREMRARIQRPPAPVLLDKGDTSHCKWVIRTHRPRVSPPVSARGWSNGGGRGERRSPGLWKLTRVGLFGNQIEGHGWKGPPGLIPHHQTQRPTGHGIRQVYGRALVTDLGGQRGGDPIHRIHVLTRGLRGLRGFAVLGRIDRTGQPVWRQRTGGRADLQPGSKRKGQHDQDQRGREQRGGASDRPGYGTGNRGDHRLE